MVENVGTSSTSVNTCGNVWAADFPPVPPAAIDGSALTHFNAPITITLRASDDGQPNPSQALTYIVTSLPSHGDLREPQGSVINSVPYTLTRQAHQLVYTPATGFLGSDGFAFKTNDGGTPPDGGDSSEEASITIEVSNAFYQETMEGSSITSWTLGKFYSSGIESGGWYWGPPIGTGYPGLQGYIGVGPKARIAVTISSHPITPSMPIITMKQQRTL